MQTLQYYGIAKKIDKKWGHLFRFCNIPSSITPLDLIMFRFTYETDDFNHMDLIMELELDPGFPKVG